MWNLCDSIHSLHKKALRNSFVPDHCISSLDVYLLVSSQWLKLKPSFGHLVGQMQSVGPFSSLVGPTSFLLWVRLRNWKQFFHLWWSSGYNSLRCWKMWCQNADSRHENLFTRAYQTFRCRLSLIYLHHLQGLNAHSQQLLLDFKTQCIFHSLWPWDCNVQMWTMKRFLIFLILRPAHVGIQQPPLAVLLHLPAE